MNQFFQDYFGMALGASIVILVVLAVRPLIKKFSHRVACLLWLVVLFRLLSPVTIEGPLPAFWSGAVPSQAIVSEAERAPGTSRAAFPGSSASEEHLAANGRMDEEFATGDLEAEAYQGQEEAWNAGQNQEPKNGQDAGRNQEPKNGQGVGQNQEPKNGQDAEKTQEGRNAQSAGETREVRDVQNADIVQEQEKALAADGRENVQDSLGEAGHNALTKSTDQMVQEYSGVKEWLATDESSAADREILVEEQEKKEGILKTWSSSLAGKRVTNVCGVIWLFGVVLLLLYGIWNYHTLRKRLQESIPFRTWEKYPVRISDMAGVPMSFGVLRRGIYVPDSFREGTKEQEIILSHEAMHLQRMDPLWKLLALLGLCLHWWNPLVWICAYLINKDIEMACDEGVLGRMGEERRGDYANALFHFAKRSSGLPIAAAFGESNAESRIKEALNYKKRSVWGTIAMVCMVALLGGCLATKPGTDKGEETEGTEIVQSGTGQAEEKMREPGMIAEITNLEQAIKAPLPFKERKGRRTAPMNVPYFGFDEGYYEINYLDELTESWKETAPEKYKALLDPGTALEILVPLKGGSAEAFEDSFSNALVVYTFANGEKAHYYMAQRREVWYPYLLAEQGAESLDEESQKSFVAMQDRIVQQKDKLAKVTAAELRSVTLRAEEIESGRNLNPVSEEDHYSIACWDAKELGEFCILQDISEADACLYGYVDGRVMMLRIGDQVHPIYEYWSNLRSEIPRIYCGDYDHDGQREFALITLGKTGTGTSGNWLRVIEVTKDGLELHEPKSQGLYSQLEQKVSYWYDEKNLMLSVETTDGEVADASLESIHALAAGEERFQWLSYGQAEAFCVMDDYLFYDVSGGIQITNKAEPEFGGIDLSCGLEYHEDGSFSVGRIRLEPAWTGPVERIDLTAGFAGEEILLKTQAELTHDGVPDWIVTSVTYQEENRSLSWEQRMAQGELCVVRVYDGARQQSAWENGSIPEGTFGNENIYWEKGLADAHVGNGQILLYRKGGKSYLLISSASMWQGTMDASYEVIAMDEGGREFVIDSAKVMADINSLESAFSVDDLVEYTERLNEWAENSRLIAMTDDSLGRRVSVGTLGQSTSKGQSFAVTFDAWEIWKGLADSINQDVFAAQASSISPINITYDYVPCTGMGNLRESLTILRKRFEEYMEWQERMSQAAQYSSDLQDGKNVITCDITHNGFPDTIIVDYAAIEKDSQAFLTIDARDEAGLFLWEDFLALPSAGWGKYYLCKWQGLVYLLGYHPLESMQGTMIGGYKVFWLNQNGEEQILEERTVNSDTAKDYEKEATEFEEAIKAYLADSYFLASTWDGELSVSEKQSNW